MTDTLTTVTNEQVAAYMEMCAMLARRYNGYHGAEYDDLFQVGWLACFLALRKGQRPSKDIVARRMLNWVNVCARQGMGGYAERVDADELLN